MILSTYRQIIYAVLDIVFLSTPVYKFWVDKTRTTRYNHFRWFPHAGVSELADEADSKSVGGNTVWVQVPSPALYIAFTMDC